MRHVALLLLTAACIEYTPVSDTPQYGMPNPRPIETAAHSDRIVQVQPPEVDVLWVIDNSCSMLEEQTALTENFPRFLDWFLGSGLDYHIGVVSTDMRDPNHSGKLIGASGHLFIDQYTEDPIRVFEAMAMLGTSGSGDERGLDAAYTALEVRKHGYNLGFLREQSGVHTVVISDERDFSDLVTSAEMSAYLNGLRVDGDDVTFSSIVSPQPVCPTAYSAGTAYLQVTAAVGGISWPICSEEWSEVLDRLGLQAAGLKREYFLSQLPVAETLRVRVDDQGVVFAFQEGVDWAYNPERNSITFFEYVPNPLAEVIIDYDLLTAAEVF